MVLDPNKTRLQLDELAASADPFLAAFANLIIAFIATDDENLVAQLPAPHRAYEWNQLGSLVGSVYPWEAVELGICRFALLLFRKFQGTRDREDARRLLAGMLGTLHARDPKRSVTEFPRLLEISRALEIKEAILAEFMLRELDWRINWAAPSVKESDTWNTDVQNYIAALPDDTLAEILALGRGGHRMRLLEGLAIRRPGAVSFWAKHLKATDQLGAIDQRTWAQILQATTEYDGDCLAYALTVKNAGSRWEILSVLEAARPGRCDRLLTEMALNPGFAHHPDVMLWVVRHEPDRAVDLLAEVVQKGELNDGRWVSMASQFREAYVLAAQQLSAAGRKVFDAMRATGSWDLQVSALAPLLASAPASEMGYVADFARPLVQADSDEQTEAAWTLILQHQPSMLVPELWSLLASKTKKLRVLAAGGLARALAMAALPEATVRLTHRQSDSRLGAIALLAQIGGEAAKAALNAALVNEVSEPVRAAIHEALQSLGADAGTKVIDDLQTLESGLTPKATKLRPPASLWLDLSKLPALISSSGTALSENALKFILEKQAKHKNIAPAPDAQPFLAHIDRANGGDFALAILNEWLGSAQDSTDRYALALAGILGDTRILPPLASWIPKWCEAARHKLAEYAAQAIALQGSDEALMLLDTLATRYRNKFRNVGAAAAKSFQVAATARGMSAQDLGDLVVPSLGFDEEGARRWDWEGGAAIAELGTDLKLAWSDPNSDRTLKGLPSSAPDSIKGEVKELGKLIRETLKAQTLRLEQSLVTQRRWPLTRWQELYQNHPVLRAFASRLVWGVYDTAGVLQRTFRRYPNGILANALGDLEELEDATILIGMVHPLDLSEASLMDWRNHLARFKVSAPFPQLERRIERLDPLHGNRRELAIVNGSALSAGTFRSRAEKRGWIRGSVVDAGFVSGYFKPYPGAGLEVTLEVDGMYMGVDPMESISLGIARFTTVGAVKRGSYTYDDPKAEDERVLAFSQVPPVVYSETLADLQEIAGSSAAKPHDEA